MAMVVYDPNSSSVVPYGGGNYSVIPYSGGSYPVIPYEGGGNYTVIPYSSSNNGGYYSGTPINLAKTLFEAGKLVYDGIKWVKGALSNRKKDPRPQKQGNNVGAITTYKDMNGYYYHPMMYPQPSIYPRVNWDIENEWGPGLYDTFSGGGLVDPYLI